MSDLSWSTWLVAAAALGLLVYLGYALLRAEEF